MVRRVITAVLTLLATGAALLAAPSPASAAVLRVCAWQLPPGYTKVNDEWSATSCGGGPYNLNVWTVESYTDKPPGAVMSVCAGWRPPGWVTLNERWSPISCGYPSTIVNNVWTIQRQA